MLSHTLTVLYGFLAAFTVVFGMYWIDIAPDIFGGAAGVVLIVLAGICMAVAILNHQAIRALSNLEKLAKRKDPSQIEDDDIIPHVERMGRNMTWMLVLMHTYDIVWGTALILKIISQLIQHDISGALINLLLLLLFLGISKNTRNKMKSTLEAIGAKTRALRDRLVEISKGMQPLPNPA